MTPQQSKIYNFICEYIAKNSYSPTHEEIATGIGISPRSISLISRGLTALASEGLVTFHDKGYRNIRLANKLTSPFSSSLPYLGEARFLDLNDLFRDEHFVVLMKDDSMREEGISAGDYVIFKKSDKADENEIVAAQIDGREVSLKHISYMLKDMVVLVPANSKLKPKAYPPARVKILGVFCGFVRRR